MSRIVCKFGGSSVANAGQFLKIKSILDENLKRRIVVPSAPGRSNSQETKVTDLLYQCLELSHKGQDFEDKFSLIKTKFFEIKSNLGLNNLIDDALEKVKITIAEGSTQDYVASRGEYLNGLLMAEFLEADFLDPREVIHIDENGGVDPKTYDLIAERIKDTSKMYVIPGFYGVDKNGDIKTFSRGGSDITGAIAARAANAEIYENWTDVSGLLMADPRIVDNPKPMKQISYREIRELAYMGAQVFHDQAIAPVKDVKIPIQIKNTNCPEDFGTSILYKLTTKKKSIAGIAGKKNVSLFSIEKSMMNRERGFGRKVLEIFEKHEVSFEHSPTGIDSMNVVVVDEELKDRAPLILSDIQDILNPDKVILHQDLSLIATVGEGMQANIGTAARLFSSLSENNVNIRIIDQGSSELNIIIGVFRKDYEKAIQSLYRCFVNETS